RLLQRLRTPDPRRAPPGHAGGERACRSGDRRPRARLRRDGPQHGLVRRRSDHRPRQGRPGDRTGGGVRPREADAGARRHDRAEARPEALPLTAGLLACAPSASVRTVSSMRTPLVLTFVALAVMSCSARVETANTFHAPYQYA